MGKVKPKLMSKPVSKMPSCGLGFGIFGAQEVGIHVTNCTSVREYAYTEDKN